MGPTNMSNVEIVEILLSTLVQTIPFDPVTLQKSLELLWCEGGDHAPSALAARLLETSKYALDYIDSELEKGSLQFEAESTVESGRLSMILLLQTEEFYDRLGVAPAPPDECGRGYFKAAVNPAIRCTDVADSTTRRIMHAKTFIAQLKLSLGHGVENELENTYAIWSLDFFTSVKSVVAICAASRCLLQFSVRKCVEEIDMPPAGSPSMHVALLAKARELLAGREPTSRELLVRLCSLVYWEEASNGWGHGTAGGSDYATQIFELLDAGGAACEQWERLETRSQKICNANCPNVKDHRARNGQFKNEKSNKLYCRACYISTFDGMDGATDVYTEAAQSLIGASFAKKIEGGKAGAKTRAVSILFAILVFRLPRVANRAYDPVSKAGIAAASLLFFGTEAFTTLLFAFATRIS